MYHFYIFAMPNDVLRLSNMRFFAYHGLFPEENALGQNYEVDLELCGDFGRACHDDKDNYRTHSNLCGFVRDARFV